MIRLSCLDGVVVSVPREDMERSCVFRFDDEVSVPFDAALVRRVVAFVRRFAVRPCPPIVLPLPYERRVDAATRTWVFRFRVRADVGAAYWKLSEEPSRLLPVAEFFGIPSLGDLARARWVVDAVEAQQ